MNCGVLGPNRSKVTGYSQRSSTTRCKNCVSHGDNRRDDGGDCSYLLCALLQHSDLAQAVQLLRAQLRRDAHTQNALKKLKIPKFLRKKYLRSEAGAATPSPQESTQMPRLSALLIALCVLANVVLAEDPTPFLVTKTTSNLKKCYIEDLPEETTARFMYPPQHTDTPPRRTHRSLALFTPALLTARHILYPKHRFVQFHSFLSTSTLTPCNHRAAISLKSPTPSSRRSLRRSKRTSSSKSPTRRRR